NRWTLTTGNGVTISARFCIMATGNLSTPRVPDFKGLDTFKGKWYHSGMWPAEGGDFSGQRVGVIGTGSSGIQMIPLIAEQAKHFCVFRRWANFGLSAQIGPMDSERRPAFSATYRRRRGEARQSSCGVCGYPTPSQSGLEVSNGGRRKNY